MPNLSCQAHRAESIVSSTSCRAYSANTSCRTYLAESIVSRVLCRRQHPKTSPPQSCRVPASPWPANRTRLICVPRGAATTLCLCHRLREWPPPQRLQGSIPFVPPTGGLCPTLAVAVDECWPLPTATRPIGRLSTTDRPSPAQVTLELYWCGLGVLPSSWRVAGAPDAVRAPPAVVHDLPKSPAAYVQTSYASISSSVGSREGVRAASPVIAVASVRPDGAAPPPRLSRTETPSSPSPISARLATALRRSAKRDQTPSIGCAVTEATGKVQRSELGP